MDESQVHVSVTAIFPFDRQPTPIPFPVCPDFGDSSWPTAAAPASAHPQMLANTPSRHDAAVHHAAHLQRGHVRIASRAQRRRRRHTNHRLPSDLRYDCLRDEYNATHTACGLLDPQTGTAR
ncbi:hypothetical protein HMN09_00015900 [Mycena chlorophos]|uniref:Uncharacterized protein n=1 Tax=Mycena chlorophos TaxID=658473 RepID=A0A8H6TRE7_MYCCL|nr:hypothetical protein HMN09_00015900 [Mycena chlorophos]